MEEILKYLVTTLIVVLGWYIVHLLTARRDRLNKRRETTIQHLIKAYQVLANEIAGRKITTEGWEKLEATIAEIQLFGSPEQIRLAVKLAYEIAKNREFQLDPLLNELRNDLRKQLGLSKAAGNVTWLRNVPEKKEMIKDL